MKRIISITCACILAFSMVTQVKADEFTNKEDHYIKLCSSSRLTKSNEKVCKRFNQYLKKKNSQLAKSIENTKSQIQQTNQNLDKIQDDIESLSTQIAKLEDEIEYHEKLIALYKKQIAEKKELMKERIYSSQSFYNSNLFSSFLFNAHSLTDLYSRISSIGQLTSYEKELAEEIKRKQDAMQEEKDQLTQTQRQLKKQKETARIKQNQYIQLRQQKLQQQKSQEAQKKSISNSQRRIDIALDAMIARDKAATSSYSGGVGHGSGMGKKIAQAALTQLGKRYWWGASGPSYYDCSGLVYWAHNKAGVSLGRTTAAGYSTMGKPVSRASLSAGDVITFSYGSGVAHIGIYLGNGKFVNASGRGSSTVGQYANQCVKVAPLAGRWQGYVHNYRRLY